MMYAIRDIDIVDTLYEVLMVRKATNKSYHACKYVDESKMVGKCIAFY